MISLSLTYGKFVSNTKHAIVICNHKNKHDRYTSSSANTTKSGNIKVRVVYEDIDKEWFRDLIFLWKKTEIKLFGSSFCHDFFYIESSYELFKN